MAVEPLPRPDWRDSVALAADLALLGIVVTLASVPVVTAGGAFAAGSVAVDRVCRDRTFPPVAELGRTFLRGLLPGLGVVATVIVAAALLALDLGAVSRGRVPGGAPVLIATGVVAAVGLAIAILALVRVGQTAGRGWLVATAWAGRTLLARPWTGLALLATAVLPVLLASAIPVTAPLLVGFTLFAFHVLTRRLTPEILDV